VHPATYTVRYDVRVAVKTAFWVTVGLVVACEIPDDQCLVATS